ncbi:DUF6154 family protein [Aneurinibacillus aneurinilyticus]|uniref:Uncharacterized protein n=1 Tax=Aneurinibacillus aneurinilyticus ATCC 12856 TaxID=649747 RepID=U1Y6G8_ANEAE|nr:DUF6154 family protein [Aneurinibacillus aneurinilyticus]ERI07742.1 hypothetical protein HMPREF0083_04183 [Aneurinibacillus aneurinilyticus ATCC 12856]MED0705569.1 DUF6154 family protein [Aneurinibacillus aneurinilyticus]MED0724460.1 DUF6154 family protein [Aneurinibacillus aneurinilyticus]MED0731295.1 DUF6154 family protein [Aneurinibacillus aneurinilyticus]MED0739329.1 DUF6154 family protein [Aneurinibacillus aneurinilyticus]
MKLVNDIYNMYRDKLTGDEEDVTAIVMGLLHGQSKEELMQWIQEMQDTEIYQMLGLYLMEMLRVKMAEEGVGSVRPETFRQHRYH